MRVMNVVSCGTAFLYERNLMAKDKDVRRYAVPVRGSIWGHVYNDRSENDIEFQEVVASTIGDVPKSDFMQYFPTILNDPASAPLPPFSGIVKTVPLRILKPHYGHLAQCYVDLDITVASGDSDLTLKLAVGKFVSGSYSAETSYTQTEVDDSWRRITGSDTPLSVSGGKISATLLDLLNSLPKYGDSNYKEDAFVLILAFNKVPTVTGTFHFNQLNIHTSVTGAL